MKVIILSTDTKHHIYFINKLADYFNIEGVIYERKRLVKSYPTGPFFSQEEDSFEERFFDHRHGGTRSYIVPEIFERLIDVFDINQKGIAEYLKALDPDLFISFGVGMIKPHIFNIPRWGTINVHRGISHEYRGLDSDLWAIWQKRFDLIGITVHYVNEALDTGDILAQETILIEPDDEIFHLRYKTTLSATRMIIQVLERIKKERRPIKGAPQKKIGAYYTAMHVNKKYEALANFTEYKRILRNAR
ncbi:MAG: hypothetical protein HQK79_04250 [Desulfobacterales bacterium]|nr:hypothetical protein [Desulfobacterales bacterium]